MYSKLTFDGCTNTAQKKVHSLKWIVENAYLKHPSVHSPAVSIIESQDSIEEKECAGKENLVSVTETTMSNWYIPYSEPGSRPFGKDRLSALFDFLRIVIWSRMVDESAASRLMFEPSLDAPELTEAVRYRDLKKMQTAQLVADIQLQPWHPSFEKPFSR